MKPRPFVFAVSLLLTIGLAGWGCHSVPVTGRSAVNLVSEEYIVKVSAEEFANMKRTQRLSRNAQQVALVERVGRRLAQTVYWDMPLADWEFVVFDAPGVINAFAMAGGKVGVYSGLLDLVENEAQLASVLAHEVAHVTARHVHERLSQLMLLEGGGVAAVIAAGNAAGSAGASAVRSVYGLGAGMSALSFDRAKEREADHIGLIYMARAGYDPREALRFLERMETHASGPSVPAWLSTHPAYPERQLQLIDLMPKALAAYEESQRERSVRIVE
jgi:predicted Zn-dependent protease